MKATLAPVTSTPQPVNIATDTSISVNDMVQKQNEETAKMMQQNPPLATEGSIGTKINIYA